MPEEKKSPAPRAAAEAPKKVSLGKCDNHPDAEAVIVTDGNGAHSEQKFCQECADSMNLEVIDNGTPTPEA